MSATTRSHEDLWRSHPGETLECVDMVGTGALRVPTAKAGGLPASALSICSKELTFPEFSEEIPLSISLSVARTHTQ